GVPNNITLAKTVDKTNVLPGETVNYTIAYSNPTTNPTLPALTITDTLPPGLTFLGGSTGFTQTGTVLNWTVSNLPPGQTGTVTLAALLDPAATVGSTVTNTAVASLSGMTPVSAAATFQVGSLAPSMLQLVKIATADSVKSGEYITYLITYNNNGNMLLPSVIIEEPIPANTTFLNGNPSPTVDTVNNKISWNVGDLPPGANGTMMAQFTVPSTVVDGTLIANVITGKVSGFQNAVTATVLILVGPVFHRAYIKGYLDKTFLPEKPVTRAEIATILSRILSLDTTMTANIGSDVPSNHWAFPYINAVVFSGVMNGYPDGTFGPERSITRAELATVMVRARGLFSLIVAPPTFPDIAGHWAAGNVEAAQRASFITGYPSGDFRPDQTITRAETVTLIDRSFGRGPLIGTGLTPLYSDVPSVHWAFSWVAEAAMSHRGLHTSDGNEMLIEVSTEPPL
ncbi:MAG: S-layer homology domain-containing protein, partial [Coprothermobacterota bacterium]|nr:S-layer homology domain-containing protein [Coprothermobacterota bacterium]